MRIVFTGGGTGGHFYPVIAVAEEVNKIADEQKILETKFYYFSDDPYDKSALFENHLEFVYIPAGKKRLYSSIQNFTDKFKAFFGICTALLKLFLVYPDVVFAKGGYASFPTLVAARILRIPVVIHESDSAPGRVTLWASKFAKAIAVSYGEAIEYFPKEKTALVGQPVRGEILKKGTDNAYQHFDLDPKVPVIGVIGGSLGAEIINNALVDVLPQLLNSYQVIHQTGQNNFNEVQGRASVIVEKHPHKERYKSYAKLNNEDLRLLAGIASIIVTRAGSMLFEFANWGMPVVIIPITVSNGDHQRQNAFNYARAGAGDVIEESNLTPSILYAEIDKLMKDAPRREEMSKKALVFAKPEAARKIAEELVNIALSHEQ